jgi:hypothetical protein
LHYKVYCVHSAEILFAGPGETRALLRSTDWAATPLGPVEQWPDDLLAAIRTVLPSRVPMLLWWGPELVQIYNEAYTAFLGEKHPRAIGQPGAECWAEVWDAVGSMARKALDGAAATCARNQFLLMDRHGYLEETYWTFSYSPVHGAGGAVKGVFVATTDTTPQVLGERRLRALRELGSVSSTDARSEADAFGSVIEVLARHTSDVPFALAYALDDLEKPIASCGVGPGAPPGATSWKRSDRTAAGWSPGCATAIRACSSA